MSHSTQHYRAHSLGVRIPAIARAFHAEFFRALHTARQLLLRQRCCSRHHALAGALRPRTVRAAAQRAVYTPPLRFNSARAFSYIDVDVHHGDGVEQAFTYDHGVFSLSFHRHGAGFFPGPGDLPQMDESDDDADEDGERRSSSATLLQSVTFR